MCRYFYGLLRSKAASRCLRRRYFSQEETILGMFGVGLAGLGDGKGSCVLVVGYVPLQGALEQASQARGP